MFFIFLIFISKEIPVIEVEGEIKKESVIQVIVPSPNENSLSDALSKESGITVRRAGTEGSFSLISIRGTNPSHTEFFLEGVPISFTPYSSVNMEDLPLQGIGRIEIAKDFVPSEFSTASIGGVINIIIPDKGREFFHYLSGKFSSFKTLSFTGYSIRNLLSHSYFFYLNLFHTDGDFRYRNSNGTPFNPYDDYISKRKNNATNRVDFLGRYTYRPSSSISLSITANLFSKEQGIAGTDVLQSEKTDLKTERGFIAGEFKLENEKFFLSLQPFTGIQNETFSDPDGEIGIFKEEVKQEFLSGGMRVNFSKKNFKRIQPSFSLLYSGMRWKSIFIKPSSFSFHAIRNEVRLSSDAEFSFSKKFSVIPQAVFYFSKTDGETGILYYFEKKNTSSSYFAFMPSISGIFKFSSHKIIMSFGRYVRIPSFFELFGDRGVWMGNPDLKPEEGIKTSVEWNGEFKGFKSSLGFFQRDIVNLISYTQNSQWTFIPENISRAFILGFEGSFELELSPFKTGANYTYLFTEDRGKIDYLRGKRLPLQPSHELHYFLNFDLLKNFSIRYEFDLQGDTFLDRANMRKRNLKTEHSIYLTKEIKKGVRIHGYVENILDEKWVDIYSIPLPGRRFGVKVEGIIM